MTSGSHPLHRPTELPQQIPITQAVTVSPVRAPAQTRDNAIRREKVKSVVRVAAGNFLEMYDFMTYGYYAAAIGPPGRKGFYVSWQSASQQLAVVFAALIGVVLHRFMSNAQMDDWGWRIPLLIGCLIVPIVFVIRRSLTETEEFARRRHH